MFTAQEKKNLKILLSRITDRDEVMTLDGLHGYLYGLAIIPEPVMPSEWLPGFFGESMPMVENEQEANDMFGGLFSAYNRMMEENQLGKLGFPFNLDTFKPKDIQRMRAWAHGFYSATSLRSEIWRMDDDEDLDDELYEETQFEGMVKNVGVGEGGEEFEDDDDDMTVCFAVVLGVAFPDRISELFERRDGTTQDSNIEASLFAMLPDAIATLQDYANSMKTGFGDLEGMSADNYDATPT